MRRRKGGRTRSAKAQRGARWRAATSLRYTHPMATRKRRSTADGKRSAKKNSPSASETPKQGRPVEMRATLSRGKGPPTAAGGGGNPEHPAAAQAEATDWLRER